MEVGLYKSIKDVGLTVIIIRKLKTKRLRGGGFAKRAESQSG